MEEIYENLPIEIKDVLLNKDIKRLKEIFETIPTIDIAESLEEIEDVTLLVYIFRTISKDYTADLFAELNNDQQELIIKAFSDKELMELLEASFADDIVDTIEELPANLVTRILKVASPELRKDINLLLNFKEDSAGSVMTTEFLEMKDTCTVKEAISLIREKGKEAETVYTIFVRDKYRTLVGTVDLDDLIFAKDDALLEEIMNRDFVTCEVNDDQEEVANMFKRYDLTAMAVVNNQNKIVGIITIDDVVDIIVEEANEDIAALNNISAMEDEYLKTPVKSLVKKCVPWIIALMILQVFSTLILSGFQGAIADFAILSVFTPLIMDAGGNSGGQTTTIIVRALALDEFDKHDMRKVVAKEMKVASLIALCIAGFAFGWLMLEMSVGIVQFDESVIAAIGDTPIIKAKLIIAGLVALTLFVTIMASRLVGCVLPFFAKAIKKDPAVMCGPITTTLVDIITLLTYFILWTYVFMPMIGII